MKREKNIMGMPITIEVADAEVTEQDFEKVFTYFTFVDNKFSTYKTSSEIMQINLGKILPANYSSEMKEVFELSEETKKLTHGYFDIKLKNNIFDPSGLVKGWAIFNASKILASRGFKNYYIVAGGDIQAAGKNGQGQAWAVGLKNPFKKSEITKVVYIGSQGVATSGTYEQGQHIYNPHERQQQILDIVSLTVIGPNVYEADRFATAAFAMGREGINFIEKLKGFEGYVIDKNGMATQTSGFNKYL